MYLEQLSYVVAIAEQKSFSKAARLLNISQPSLSQSISNLERSLGTRLFDRSTSSVELTYSGECFMKTAQDMLSLYDGYRNQIADIEQLRSGRLVIGVPNFRGSIILSLALPAFIQRYPGIDVEIIEATTRQLELITERGQTNITILNLPFRSQSLSYIPLTNERILLAVSREHPLASGCQAGRQDFNHLPRVHVSQLAREDFIILKPGHRIRQTTDEILKTSGISYRIRLEVNNLFTAHRLVSENVGIMFIGETAAKFSFLSPEPVYFELYEQPEPWSLVAAYRSDRYLPRAAQEFVAILKNKL